MDATQRRRNYGVEIMRKAERLARESRIVELAGQGLATSVISQRTGAGSEIVQRTLRRNGFTFDKDYGQWVNIETTSTALNKS